MTNTELAELFLLRLYDLAEAGGYSRFHSLDEIAHEFGVTDRMKVFNIGKSLENRGLITPAFTHDGSSACINGDGALFAEQGGSTGVIAAFRRDPGRFLISVDQSTHFHGAVSGSNIAIHSDVESQQAALPAGVENVLKAIADRLTADSSLDERRRGELQRDVEAIRSELYRSQPRRGVLRELLGTLADVSSIGQFVIQLQPLLSSLGGS